MSKLAEILQNEVAAEVAAIASNAQAKADALLADAKTRAEALVANKRRSLEAELVAETKRAESGAELLLNQAKIGARGRVIETVKTEAGNALKAMSSEAGFGDVLTKLATQALSSIGKAESVVVGPAHASVLEGWAKANDLKLITDTAMGLGVRINAEGGKSSVQNALDERLKSAWDSLSAKAAKAIWG